MSEAFLSKNWIIQIPALAMLGYFGWVFSSHYISMDQQREAAREIQAQRQYEFETSRSEAIRHLADSIESASVRTDTLTEATRALRDTVETSKEYDKVKAELLKELLAELKGQE